MNIGMSLAKHALQLFRRLRASDLRSLLLATLLCCGGISHAAQWYVGCGDNAGLINAMAQSNQTIEDDRIDFRYSIAQPGYCDFNFSSANNLTDGPNALPSIASRTQAGKLTIGGFSNTVTRFMANTRTSPLRLFHIAPGGDLTLTLVWLTQAGDVNGVLPRIDGGAIYNRGRLAMYQSFFAQTSGERGGGLYNASNASALLYYSATAEPPGQSPIFNPPVPAPLPLFGGGIFNAGILTIRNSWIQGNMALTEGAGIYNDVGGVLDISQSSLATNKMAGTTGALPGGGLANHGTATLTNASIGDNEAGTGAGLANYGDITLSHVTIAENAKSGNGASAFFNRGVAKTKNSLFFARGISVACDGGATTRGKNLASDGSCGAAFTNVGNVYIDEMWRNPRLAPNNPAIDATTDCSNYTGQRLIWDQLYAPRLLGKSCDLGSIEYVPPVKVQLRTFTSSTPDFGLISGAPASGLVLPTLDATTDLPILNLSSPYVGTNASGSPLIQSATSFGKWFAVPRTLSTTPLNRMGDWYGLPVYWNQMGAVFPTTTIPQYYSLQLSAYVDIPMEWYVFPQFPLGGGAHLSLYAPDDTWVFVDGNRVIDAGGLHAEQAMGFNLMTLGPGRHRLDMFNARRAAASYANPYSYEPSLQLYEQAIPLVSLPTTPRISNLVTLTTVPGSVTYTNDTTGCKWGTNFGFSGGGGSNYIGKALFATEVKNIGNTRGAIGKTLSNLQLEIRTLSTDNLVVHQTNLPMRVGGRLDALRTLGYNDGKLAPGEMTQVPVAVCVTSNKQFNITFDAFGTAN